MPVDTGWALVDAPDDLALKPVVIQGPSGYQFRRFEREEVGDFMRRMMTVHLIAIRLGIEHKEVARRPKIVFVPRDFSPRSWNGYLPHHRPAGFAQILRGCRQPPSVADFQMAARRAAISVWTVDVYGRHENRHYSDFDRI